MKRFTTLLVSIFAMFVISWQANAAGIQATTMAEEALVNVVLELVRIGVRAEGKQSNVPFEECYKSLFLKEWMKDPALLSDEDKELQELTTLENLNYLSTLSANELRNGIMALFGKAQNAELSKEEKLMRVAMGLGLLAIDCVEFLE